MNKLKIAFMTIVGVFLVGVGAVLGYQSETPVALDKLLEDYYNEGYKEITWWRDR